MSFFREMPSSDRSGDPPGAARFRELYGFIPRVFRLQTPLGDIVEKQGAMLEALLGNENCLSRAQKERILLTVSAANQSQYGVALHEQMLKVLGVPEAEIAHIVNGGSPEGPDGELIAFARRLVLSPLELREADVERLRRVGFREPQIVEVVILIGACNLFNTLQFGTGATPDFAPRTIPPPVAQNNAHPEPAELRPIIEEVQEDPDAEWVIRAKNGDLGAFEGLVERHTQRVYRTLIGLLGNPDDAKDALQDTFLKAFQSLPGFERRSRFSTWLVSIASNTGLQRLRERRQVESLDEDASDHEEFRPRQIRAWGDDPEEMYSKAERRALVEQAISRLPAKYRMVLVLRDVQQLSTDEAAASLGLGVPALKARLLRGRLMLREALAPHFMEGAQTA